ncbi:MAG: spore maturation protein [Ruminococcus sp.]|nr:spore maturation protein [Ruminococcus sp.]
MQLSLLAAPAVCALILIAAAVKRVDIIGEFTLGAREGLQAAVELMPTLLLTVSAITMLYRSGTLGAFAELISPAAAHLGFPAEAVPLAMIRPLSGSGALAVFENIISADPDSFASRTAAVLMGSTETTFYTIAVYFAAVRLRADARVFISSLTADFAGFVFSALIVRLFY